MVSEEQRRVLDPEQDAAVIGFHQLSRLGTEWVEPSGISELMPRLTPEDAS